MSECPQCEGSGIACENVYSERLLAWIETPCASCEGLRFVFDNEDEADRYFKMFTMLYA